jgi:hypothetical protein
MEAKADKFERLRAGPHITGVSALLPNFRPGDPRHLESTKHGDWAHGHCDCVSPLKGAPSIEALDERWARSLN